MSRSNVIESEWQLARGTVELEHEHLYWALRELEQIAEDHGHEDIVLTIERVRDAISELMDQVYATASKLEKNCNEELR